MTPDDEHARIRERERGLEAQRILSSTLWQDAFNRLEGQYRDVMAQGSDEETLDAKRSLHVLYRVRRAFEDVLRTGEFATQQLEVARDGRSGSIDGA